MSDVENEKYIQVKWQPEDSCYGRAMIVCLSSHPRFKIGSRFDYDYMGIATAEGYEVTVLPMNESEVKK